MCSCLNFRKRLITSCFRPLSQVVGGILIVIMLPLVAPTTQSASYVFSKVDISSATTGITSPVYSVMLSWLVSQYSLYGYDAAAHLTEETKNADKNGPLAILSSIGVISVVGWAFILALTFSIQVGTYSLLIVLEDFLFLVDFWKCVFSFLEKQLLVCLY